MNRPYLARHTVVGRRARSNRRFVPLVAALEGRVLLSVNPPTGLTATAVSPVQINLAWTNQATSIYYTYVEQSTDDVNWTQIASIYGAPTTYAATGPFNGSTTYYYEVYNYCSPGGYTANSSVASVTTPAYPNPPTLNSATTVSNASVALSWTAATGATGYSVQRSTNGGSTWVSAGTTASGVTTFTDTGLTEATSYSYEVLGTNSVGNSAPSAIKSAATLPTAPSGLTATAVSGSQINLSWTDHSTAAVYYYVAQSPNGTTWTTVGSISSSTANSYTATGPFNGSTTYYFEVYDYAYTGGDSANATATATTPAFPNQPTITSATAQSATSIALVWSNVTGATGYQINRSANSGSTWTTAGTVGTGVTTFTDTGLTEATSYWYQLVATNAAGSSAASANLSAATQPAAPSGLTATAVSGSQINLTWTDHSAAAVYYYVLQSPNGTTWTTLASVYGSTTNSYTATGPFNGSTTYYFEVYDYAYTGGNSANATATVTTPAFPNQPTISSATAQSATSIALVWSNVTGATGFTVQRSTNGGSTWTTAGTVGTGVTTYTDTGLTEATSYTYHVIATDAAGSSAPSANLSAATQPLPPSGLTATAVSGSQINLTWTDHSTAASYYYVLQSPNGTTWTTLASLYGSTINSYTATGPFNGSTTYYFEVYAYAYTGGNSANATATVTTPAFPNQPTISSATAQSATSIALVWSNVTGATGYRVQRMVSGTWTTEGTVGTGVTTFTDTGLTEATTYSYEVTATNAAGSSAPSATMSTATQPAAPSGLTATAVSGSQINLTWTDHSAAAVYYYVAQSPNGTTWTTLTSIYSSTANSYTATGPFNGSTTYYFEVYDYAYTGGYSANATATVTTPAFPNPPTITSATAQSATSIALVWSNVTGATGFTVQHSTNGGSTWTTAGTVGTGVTTFTDTGLTEATSYTYHVIATDAAGSSAPSANLSAATQPAAPSGLTATAVSGSQINLTWTDHSTAASYYYVLQSPNGTTWTTLASLYGSTINSYTATGPFNGSTTYYFEVYAYAYTGGNSANATATVTTPAFPNQPTISSATAQSDTSVLVTWSNVTGATGFQVQRQVSGTWTSEGTLGTGVTSYTDTGLHEVTSYSYQVIATNSAGSSAPSATVSATTLPSAPTGLTATGVAWNQVNLTWTDHSAVAYYYYVQQSPDNVNWTTIASIYGSTTNSYTAAGPFNGSTTYYFRVNAYDGAYSTYATASVVTPAFPNTPTISSATPAGGNSIALSWQDVPRETGFQINRQVSGTWTQVGTVGAGVLTFTNTGLSENTSYSYQVVATDSVGSSPPSATVSAVTNLLAPTGLTPTVASGALINLSWTNHSTAATSNYVFESPDNVNWTQIATVSASTSTYAAAGTYNRLTTYYFRVEAYTYSYVNYSPLYSSFATASVTTPNFPYTPAINWALPQSSSSVALSWTNAPGATGFQVQRSSNGGTSWTTAGTVGSGVTTFTDTGLSENTSYMYEVVATSATGTSSPSATASAVTPPGAPTGLSAVVASGNQINLTWTDHSSAATSYVIVQSPTGNSGWVQVGSVSGASATTYTATGPFLPSTAYYFRVEAYAYPGGDSAPAAASATTPAFPGAPTLISATAQSATSVALAWTSVTGATGYKINRSTNNGSTWTTAGTVGTGVTSFTDTGLSEATSYAYQVVATNAAGSSTASASLYAATQPLAPTGLTATVVSGGQINLSWTDHSTAASYYYVEQSPNGSTGWQQIGYLSGSTSNSLTATGPFAGSTTYYFEVQAYAYTGGVSTFATASATTPAFPGVPILTSVMAQSSTSVAIVWSNVTGATGFTVQRSTNNGSTWTTAGTVGTGVTSFTDTGLSEATSYTYQVIATSAAGSSAPSENFTAATPPLAPTGLLATVVSGGQINLSWTDHSTAAADYYVEQSPNGSTGWQQIGYLSGSTPNSLTATGPFAGSTTYYFEVQAYAYTGGISTFATASATTPAFPNQPTLSSATPSATSVALVWANVTGATGFTVQRSTNYGSTWTTAGTVGTGVTTFTDTGLSEATSYMYHVIATNAAGSSAPSASLSAATLPLAPTGLTATVVSGGQINLSWTDHSTAASYYYVQQSPNGSTGWQQIGFLSGSTPNSFSATGPFNGSTTYYFEVYAYAYTGGGSANATASATTPAFPNQPTLNSATPSATSVALVWANVTGATGFTVQRSINSGSTWTTAGTVGTGVTTFTDTGLSEATSYMYHVIATNAAGSSAPSANLSAATLPLAPTGLTATVVSGGQINLSWTDHSTAASYYYVQQSPNGSTGWQQIGFLSGSTPNSFSATGPFNGSTTYYFEVYAYAYTGGGSANATASATTPAFPNQPTLNSATPSATSVALVWTNVTGATGFTVQRSINSGSTWTTAGTVGSGVTTFTDTGLSESTSYLYHVIATDAAGSSAPSTNLSAVTQPLAPTGLTASIVTSSQANLTWTDHSAVATYYYISESTNGTTWQQVGSVYGTTANSYTVTGAFNGSTLYYFEVYANAYPGGNSANATATTTSAAFPSQPTLSSATAQSDTAIALVWTNPAGETGFRVERSTSTSGPWMVLAVLAAGTTTYTDAGLIEGSTFSYHVVATNSVGDSAPSPALTATTLPAAPTGFTVSFVSGHQAALSWTDHSAVATGYIIERSPNGTSGWVQVATTDGQTTSTSDPGPFSSSTAYYFRIHASAYVGSSNYATVNGTTPAFPNAPTGLAARPATNTSITVTWSDVANETGFRIVHSTGSNGPWTTVGTVAQGVLSFADTGLLQSTRYYYEVVATSAVGESAYSAAISTIIATPVANNDAYTVSEDTSLTTTSTNGVLANDTTTSGDTLTAVVVARPGHGTLTFNSNGSFVYTPTIGYLGTDTFTYTADDGALVSNIATVSLTVPQSVPVATNDAYTVTHGKTLTTSATGTGNSAGVLVNDTNADGLSLTATRVANVSHGTLTFNSDGSFVYTPAVGYYGSDSFTYTATGGTKTSSPATVSIHVSESAPVANGDAYIVASGATLTTTSGGTGNTASVLHNDTDADSDPLSATLKVGPQHASTFSFNSNGTFTYTPAAGFSGSDSFTYQASDGVLSSQIATAVIETQPPTPTVGPAGGTFNGLIGNFNYSDLSATASQFTATITWSDGTTSPGVVTADPSGDLGGFDVSGSHTYASSTTYAVSASVTAPNGTTIPVTNSITIDESDTPQPVAEPSVEIAAGSAYNGVVAMFDASNLGGVASDFSAAIEWGDGNVTVGTITPEGSGEFEVTGADTYTAAGTYPITVEVDSDNGTSITMGGTAVIDNAPVSASGDSISLDDGDSFDGEVATVDDGNPYDVPADLTATIDWGDGSGTTTGTIVEDAPGVFSVDGDYTYSAAGAYAILVTLTLQAGSSTTATGSATVAQPGNSGASSTVPGAPKTYFGHVAATVASFPAAYGTTVNGSLSIAGLPGTATIVKATLYADNYNNAGGANPSMTFAGNSLGAPASSGTNGQSTNYQWDVTNLVTGNGSFAASLSGMTNNYGVTLLVIYSDPSLPDQNVTVNDNPADLHPQGSSVTFTETYKNSIAGIGDLWIHTDADNGTTSPTGADFGADQTGETISLNGQVIGGPIDANLGYAASLFHFTNLNANNNKNTVSIMSPGDWFDWNLTVFTTPAIDLIVDSNNSDDFNVPTSTPAEEKIKDDPTLPGKVIITDTNNDNDGTKPDSANFATPRADLHFVPIVLVLPSSLNVSAATVTFDYSSSDPGLIGPAPTFTPAPGSLRIWTLPGSSARNPASVAVAGGNYVAGGVAYSASSLGFTATNNSVTLWVEGIAPSAALGDLRIVAKVDPDGSGNKQGMVDDAVRVTAAQVQVQQIDFTGTGNVNIRINATDDIGMALGAKGTGDIEWVNGSRNQPNTAAAAWASNQSAPAAFVRGNAVTAAVTFKVVPTAITAINISAVDQISTGVAGVYAAGVYGDMPATAVTLSGGLGTETISTKAVDNNVDINTLFFTWQLQGITPNVGGAITMPTAVKIQKTSHRIYTLYAAPLAPMAEPWVQVLELSTGIAKGLGSAGGDDVKIVTALTTGIYNSGWKALVPTADFINPTATLTYIPKRRFTTIMGPTGGAVSSDYIQQQYDLTSFLKSLAAGTTWQQCNDDSNLLAILADSLGISVTPLWFATACPVMTTADLLAPTSYFGAGETTITRPGVRFFFHQIDAYGGLVYDPSTSGKSGGPPTMNMTFANYITTAFPTQGTLGTGTPVQENVTTITVK